MVIQYKTWHISRSDASRNVFICMLLARMMQELGPAELTVVDVIAHVLKTLFLFGTTY